MLYQSLGQWCLVSNLGEVRLDNGVALLQPFVDIQFLNYIVLLYIPPFPTCEIFSNISSRALMYLSLASAEEVPSTPFQASLGGGWTTDRLDLPFGLLYEAEHSRSFGVDIPNGCLLVEGIELEFLVIRRLDGALFGQFLDDLNSGVETFVEGHFLKKKKWEYSDQEGKWKWKWTGGVYTRRVFIIWK